MQRFILGRKNQIASVSGVLIIAGFIFALGLKNTIAADIAFMIASVLGAAPIAIQAYQALRVRVVSIDLLVTLAVTGAFLIRNFEESAIVTFLFLFGAWLEQRTLSKTRSAIRELTEMAPESALKQMPDGSFAEVSIDEVDVGDILLVKTGAKIPVDGTIMSGEGSISEASITGESIPVLKGEGDKVFAGTILDNGTIRITADRVGEDTTFARIIELVEEAQDSKSKAERFIDRFARYYTPAVLILGTLVFVLTRDLELAVTILVLGCPGALVIGVPVSNVAGIGNGARHGVLFKGSEVISDFSRVETIVFDKTGTLTAGKPEVTEKAYFGDNIDKALKYLASVERESDHPLARAVLEEIGETTYYTVGDTEVVKGCGIIASVDGHRVAVGNPVLMEMEGIDLGSEAKADIARFEKNANSLVLTAVDGKLKILMGVRDPIRPGVKGVLQELKKMGVRNLVMLSGDNQGTVESVSRELGLTEAHGNMLPEDKAEYIRKLIEEGRIVAFVGDGVNDSPSLALANIGIAMGGGTDAAIETSDVVLMNSDIGRLQHALGLAKATAANMKQNIAIAVGIVLLLLAGVLFSEWMNMSVGMLVHEGSILAVILNAMRLLRYKPKS
ncbi:MAG TPA: cation-translocating P-type ATPase [Clostridiales bacterium]|nr:cation-translocating P-type ATPase [Clostridiales bacterium]HPV01240.1 cation-translocating P-type ATPase [Clostridiales bacterium]